MGNYMVNIPDDIHKKLNHLKIDTEKDINELIVDFIMKGLRTAK